MTEPARCPGHAHTVRKRQVGALQDGGKLGVAASLHDAFGVDTDQEAALAGGDRVRHPIDGGLLADWIHRHPEQGEAGHAATACRYTSAVSRPSRSTLKVVERRRPASRRRRGSSSNRSSRSMAWVSSSTLSVRSTTPASSTSSVSASAEETITGAPHDIASSTGKPKPSYREG